MTFGNSIPGTKGDSDPLENARRQREAKKRLTECELMCGKTVEELDAFHAAERERVLRKLGLAA